MNISQPQKPTIGLTLGGGGARGLAHIGVLKVLERENIAFDYLAGTSMGGILAASYGAGLTVTEIETQALSMPRLLNLARLVMIAAITAARLNEAAPDVLIRPDVADNITIFTGFSHAAEIIAAGEQATQAALPMIHSLLHKTLDRNS